MTQNSALTCPICGKGDEIEMGTRDDHVIQCPTHGEFEITDSALIEKPREPKDWERALERVKRHAAPGRRPRIYTFNLTVNRFTPCAQPSNT